MHALIVSLPSDSVQALDAKDYIGFIEKDQAGKIKNKIKA